jgi:hypothetical protein
MADFALVHMMGHIRRQAGQHAIGIARVKGIEIARDGVMGSFGLGSFGLGDLRHGKLLLAMGAA